ncbi:MAG: GH3 auxin-responsive promoter family protein [Candidatus Bathyarchaeota archaeon]|nr:MAG: GH3 auxin-responsive promoter family protein [Candidatus Bathyarchaeota archaeon]
MPDAAPFGLGSFLAPWYEGLKDPEEAQANTLRNLLKQYSKTGYGVEHGAERFQGVDDYRLSFPVIDYGDLKTLLEPVKEGDHHHFLSEPPEVWVMTRGSTGVPKVLPATKTHLQQILSCGARALLNLLSRNPELMAGKMLNLSLPSRVAEIQAGKDTIEYGYSSGTYSRLFPSLGDALLVPGQEEVDRLGSGIKKRDWEERFRLVYQRAVDESVFAAIGVAPVIRSFARYLKRVHGKKPKDLWEVKAIICTSVRKIHVRYAPLFRKYFGEVSTVEIYSATEGVFAQQLNQLPYVSPNYDTYLFEVETGRGLRMLHELERGEWGRLIVSTCMFPRYDIGDMIEAMGDNYFRVFGRAKLAHILEHRLYRALFKWFL